MKQTDPGALTHRVKPPTHALVVCGLVWRESLNEPRRSKNINKKRRCLDNDRSSSEDTRHFSINAGIPEISNHREQSHSQQLRGQLKSDREDVFSFSCGEQPIKRPKRHFSPKTTFSQLIHQRYISYISLFYTYLAM